MATLQPTTYNPNAGVDGLANDSKEQRMTTWADFRSPAHPPADVDKLPLQAPKTAPPPPSCMTDSTTETRQQQELDWTYDASRAAARNAFAKQKRISFGNAARQKAKRKSRHLAQTMRPAKPTIRVDTSISTHRGTRPKQIYPREKPVNIFDSVRGIKVSEETRPPAKPKKWAFLGLGGRRNEPERVPTYELQENQQVRDFVSSDNEFRGFRTKTLRSHPQPVQTRQEEPFVPPTPPPPPLPVETHRDPGYSKDIGPVKKTPIDVSPSDQPITIGFSVSPEQAHEHDSSPVSSHHGHLLDPSHITRQRSGTAASGDAPTIIVTPAYERTGWLAPANNRPRPASSVYSRATNAYTVYHSNGEIPAVPAIPSSYAGQLQAQPLPERGNDGGSPPEKYPGLVDMSTTPQRKRDKMASGTTVFEEDSNPATPKSVKGPNGLYIDTNIPPTPHRSRGWWNIITTPFEFTPRTPRFRFSTRGGSERGNTTPDVPMIPAAAAFSQRSPPLHAREETPTRAQSPVLDTSKQHVQAAKAPNSASTVFSPAMYSPASWEHSPANESPRTHDDLGISTGVGSHETSGKSQPRPLSQSLQSETFSPDDRGTPATWGQGYGQTARPDPTQQGAGDVYINHHYHYNGVPFYRDGGPPPRPARTETLRSTDTTPVLGVAALGAVLSARAVHKSNDPASTPRSMNATVEEEPSPQMIQTEQRNEYLRQAPAASTSTAPQATSLYFPPPPNHAHSHTSEQSSRSFFQFSKSKAENPVVIKHEFEKAPKMARTRGAGGYWSLWPWKKQKNPQDPRDPKDPAAKNKKKKKRRRCCCCCCLIFLILLIIMAALLGALLPRSHHSSSSSGTGGSSSSSSSDPASSSTAPAPDIPSVWLNLTGYPPIPTGVATIARPDNFFSENGCTSPNTMWSCAVPKDEQDDIEPNDPDQPNFKFQIEFVNGTVSNISSTIPLKTAVHKRRLLDLLRRASEPEASPAAPSLEDQNFLGNTTDGNSQPFSGEETPFFITFYSGDHVSYRLVKRASTSSSNGSIADIIPGPEEDSDGTAAAANLVFYPKNQPLRLYNRGRSDEHYGFYNYYNRSIFLKNIVASNSSDTGELSADQNGGATKEAARYRCTWAQTRMLVQIWTNSQSSKSLLVGSSTATSTASAAAASASASSGVDFNQPGSFAYPVTISIDRHGGNVTEKMVYCWSLDDDGKYIEDSAKLQLETRDFGGKAVNPSKGPYGNVTVSTEDGGPGGIDGGTGGCGCQWRNWDNA